MNFDELFPTRVSMARNSLKLTQSELAKKVGVVPRQIAAYEGGEAKPREKALNNLAVALGTSAEWLKSGVGDGPDISNVRKTITVPEIPLYTYDQAYGLYSGKANLVKTMAPIAFVTAPERANRKCFALSISGDSMESSEGVSFTNRSIITFDPGITPQNGDFVLAYLHNHQDVTFKQLIKINRSWYLHPLNPSYSDLALNDDMDIFAVAIHSQYDLYELRIRSKEDGLIKPTIDSLGEIYESDLGFKHKENKDLNNRLNKIESMLEKLIKKTSQ
ncbi:XRE family transcriptional regulator [Proteus sp. FZP2095]|uniref:LexA family protein n=1 Tax=Proteus sp. FZP2095 TaxID=2950158 RepID=UPI002034552E|nr:XRE family transcriptional regulator [Proteus sp. FZP2095]MCM2366635.1 XRE family transcriptional regulator [Proteus sp. FZP2095]